MKTIHCFVFLCLTAILTLSPAFALNSRNYFFESKTEEESDKPSFVSVETGLLYGTLYEYVYDGGRKLSELDWELKPLYFAGLSAGCESRRIQMSVGFFMGLPARSGYIEDFDWDGPNGEWSHYSKHDNHVTSAYFLDLALGYRMNEINGIELVPLLGYRRIFIKMEARDGYLQYPPGSEPVYINGTGIIYEQKYDIPFIGMETVYDFTSEISGSLWINYSPIASCKAVDTHVFRDLVFYDSINEATYISVGAAASWLFSPGLSLRIKGAAHYVPESKGSETIKDKSTGITYYTPSDSVGVELRLLELNVSIQYYW